MSENVRTVAGEPRLCECGCGIELDGRPNRRYVNSAHRKAAWRQRTGYHVVGRQDRQKASQRRKSRRSGRQVSYRKAVDVLVARLAAEEFHWCEGGEDEWRTVVEDWLRDALPEKQR